MQLGGTFRLKKNWFAIEQQVAVTWWFEVNYFQ